jgi:nucleotide-binding universal stress UspA family protein
MRTTRLLVGFDERRGSNDALVFARLLARVADADLVVGTVIEDAAIASSAHASPDAVARAAESIHAQARAAFAGSRLEVSYRAAGGEAPAPGLLDLAAAEEADLIVIGSTHRGALGRLALGTTADALIRRRACPFAVAPRGYADAPDPDLQLIGLAYDGSLESRRAAQVAIGLALASSAPIRIFGVREPLTSALVPTATIPAADEVHKRLERRIDALIDSLPAAIGGQKVMLQGDTATALLDQGTLAASVMVFGCQGFGRVLRTLVGSVTSKVVRAAPWPVIVVPEAGRLPFTTAVDNEATPGAETHEVAPP